MATIDKLKASECLLDLASGGVDYEIPFFGSGWDARILGEILSVMTLYDNEHEGTAMDLLDLANDCMDKAIIQDKIFQALEKTCWYDIFEY